jgi:competence protein ComEC
MVLGDKKNIPPAVYDSMSKTGTVHILVVSGFNVGIVAFIIMLILKVSRLPRKARYVLAILCVIIYCFATGVQAPVLRATIMAVFLLTGFLIRREPDVRNSFSLAMFFILLTDPRALFSISFQLSFVSVAAIVFLYPKLKAFFRVDYLKLKVFKALAESFLISLSAWLGTLGFIAYYFNFFSPVTVLANLFIVPLATLITLSGFSLVVISLIFPVLAGYFAYANEFFVAMLLAVSSMLVRLPFAYLYL